MAALEELANIDFVRVLVTARPDTKLPEAASLFHLPQAPKDQVGHYLDRRRVPEERRGNVVDAARGNWLVIRVLADVLVDRPDAEIREVGQLAFHDAYEELLSRCGASGNNDTQRILEVLAAAGAGSLLPLPLLCAASKELDGPSTPAAVRDHLVLLRGLAVRSAAGTEQEHVGLFHDTLSEHVATKASDGNRGAHRALLAAIDALAPTGPEPTDLNDPGERYAFEREAEHLWALGRIELATQRLSARSSPVPSDNLRRWRLWLSRAKETFRPDHPLIFTIRQNIALWTGERGDAREALRLCKELLPDQERILGRDHRDTLRTLGDIASWTGRCGDPREALRLYKELLRDRERVLGRDHPDTLTTHHNIAFCLGKCGEIGAALRLCKKLLPDQERVLGPDHPDTLRTRGNIAFWIYQSGGKPLRLFKTLLPDEERVLGRDHPFTLRTRTNIASCTGQRGDAREALRLFKELLPDRERVLGPDHPDTLRTRSDIASWSGECGDARKALSLFKELLPDQERALGCDHPDTLTTRQNIASWTGECGYTRKALRLFKELLPDQERVLGRDHQHTLTTRGWIVELSEV